MHMYQWRECTVKGSWSTTLIILIIRQWNGTEYYRHEEYYSSNSTHTHTHTHTDTLLGLSSCRRTLVIASCPVVPASVVTCVWLDANRFFIHHMTPKRKELHYSPHYVDSQTSPIN